MFNSKTPIRLNLSLSSKNGPKCFPLACADTIIYRHQCLNAKSWKSKLLSQLFCFPTFSDSDSEFENKLQMKKAWLTKHLSQSVCFPTCFRMQFLVFKCDSFYHQETFSKFLHLQSKSKNLDKISYGAGRVSLNTISSNNSHNSRFWYSSFRFSKS